MEQCPSEFLSSHCAKRILDDVNTNQGLVLGKQRKQKGILVDSYLNLANMMSVKNAIRKL